MRSSHVACMPTALRHRPGLRNKKYVKIHVFTWEQMLMSMADRDGHIWYDGKLVPWRDANTHVLTHSLHYGLALF